MKTRYTLTANIYRREGVNAPKLEDSVLLVGTDVITLYAAMTNQVAAKTGHQHYFAADIRVTAATDTE